MPSVMFGDLRQRWTTRTLSTRFVIASSLAVCAAMFAIGAWVDSVVRKAVIQDAALASARHMEVLIEQHVQELATQRSLSADAKLQIAGLVEDSSLGRKILETKVWLPDGTVVFSSEGTHVGEKPPLTTELLGSLSGRIMADFDDQTDVESFRERNYGKPIFEVYAPMREFGSDRIIAVAEVYEDATGMVDEFTIARQQSWLVVGSITFAMLTLLFGMVHRGSMLILAQRDALKSTLGRHAMLLEQNEELRGRVTRAHVKSTALSEKLLCRIGADLHDGPAQLLSLALLRLHEVEPPGKTVKANADAGQIGAVEHVRKMMQDALAEIRHVSAGASLPDIETLAAEDVIRLAAACHERHTETTVDLSISPLPQHVSLSVRTCMFRCIQQGLNNAFRHAGGKGQKVSAWCDGAMIGIIISDGGPGFDPSLLARHHETLGIPGLRNRVESLGGTFKLRSAVGAGTSIQIQLPHVSST